MERQRKTLSWEANLRERERAIEAFQTKEFIDFALTSAQTAQQMSTKEEELRAEEELLNHERHIIMENLEEMKKIRSQLETQHRNVKNSQRLDVPADLREPKLDAKAEQLRIWEVNLLAREHAVDQREVDVARLQMDLQERERHLQVKYMTVQELKAQIHVQFSQWEDDLMGKEKILASKSEAEATLVARKALDSMDSERQIRGKYDNFGEYLLETNNRSTSEILNNKQSSSHRDHLIGTTTSLNHLGGSDWRSGMRGDDLHHIGLSSSGVAGLVGHTFSNSMSGQSDRRSPNKWPKHLSRHRELHALNTSLQRGKENSLLGVSFT